MKRSRLVLVALAVLALIAWKTGGSLTGEDAPDPDPAGGGNRSTESLSRALADTRGRGGAWMSPPRLDGAVTISGSVIDLATQEGVGGVEVVFRSSAGEETTMAGPDGRYQIDVPAGTYRAFVRDETVLSIGDEGNVRLPAPPSADAAGAPDELLMPLVQASTDIAGLDLTVSRGGMLRGKVLDRSGRPIANAVVRARTNRIRPSLGTDIAETGADGAFELRLPEGGYDVEVHHARYAGIAGAGEERQLTIAAGEVQSATFTLVAGCVIAGRVVAASGRPAGEGAIELRWGSQDSEFAPSGRIHQDGTFRWTTTEETEIVLRAWPWKSPPSPARAFACRDGARYEDVVFALPERGPDLDGILVDRSGAPVALAYIDLLPLDEGGMGQQERTDEQGRWSVYQLPAGRYRVTAYAAGRGVISTTISAPQSQVRLALGGTGRLEGRTPLLARGSFELGLLRCEDGDGPVRLPVERRLVTVVDHAFTVEDVPACDLQYFATWRNRSVRGGVEVPAGGAVRIELGIGPPRTKVVRGTVTDEAGRPVEGVTVRAVFEDASPVTATSDAAGRYTLSTFASATLVARHRVDRLAYMAYAVVGTSDADAETIDLPLLNVNPPRGDDDAGGDPDEGEATDEDHAPHPHVPDVDDVE